MTNCPRSFQNSCVIDTRLSHFHKMVVTVMKTTYRKLEPRIVYYRDLKYFCNNSFKESLQKAISQNLGVGCDEIYESFASSCNNILDNHTPLKKKYVRGNHSPFMNKSLSKAIMVRTRLRNIFLKSRGEENKTRNLCVTLLRKSKREYYQNLSVENVCDNKKFWKVVKPLLSNKIMSSEKITLVEGTKNFKNGKETAKVLAVVGAILKYRTYPSIIAIKENCNSSTRFNFSFVDKEDILKEIKNLKSNKATQNTDIPTKLIKENSDIFADFIFENLNDSISQSVFPSALKLANITPVHKKYSKSKKDHYRPISILPSISKIYERFFFKQISEYFEQFLSKYQCGFRKGFSAKNCLLSMLEKWKSAVDNKKVFGAPLTDLSKVFDCHSYDLLIAKLNAYRFSMGALRLVQNYLSNWKQRTKINTEYSSREEILF